MDLYVGCKLIKAEPLGEDEAWKQGLVRGPKPEIFRDGYKVVYEDGYESWSPASTFERAYRKLNTEEIAFFRG